MEVKTKVFDVDATSLKSAGDDGAALGEGVIARFDAVVTTNKEDRDHDILEPSGAVLDTKMPLLWQHSADSPIGRYVETVSRDGEKIIGRYEVADTPLGRDAVSLMKLGILRISHGFRALEYESRTTKEGSGYHFKRFEIVETSLVSIPANPGANIVSLTTKSFESPAVQAWVKSFVKGQNIMSKENETPVLTAEAIEKAVENGMSKAIASLTAKAKGDDGSNADGAGGTGEKRFTPADLLKAAAGGGTGTTDVRVKSIGERYSKETRTLKHAKAGETVRTPDGREPVSMSELNHAKAGAFLKRLAKKAGIPTRPAVRTTSFLRCRKSRKPFSPISKSKRLSTRPSKTASSRKLCSPLADSLE